MALTARLLVSFPLLWVALAGQSFVTFGSDGADRLFRLSRNAVGGEASVVNVTSMVMKGTVQVSTADGGPAERAIELRILLPDQYLRIESGGTWTKRSGFSGDRLLTEITKNGVVDRPPATMTDALLRAEKQRLARLLLGTASLATPEVWLNVRMAPGTSEAGNVSIGRVLEAASKDNFLVRVFYDAAALPMRVEYEANRRRISTAFGDRRTVGALLLPHTMTTTLDGMPLEEIRLSEIAVNPALTKADFGG
jgi:hypothetical protein